jgi:hypothetical protein
MELLIDLLKYFKTDPMRILALVGGSGGLVYWIDRYQNRVRIKIKLIDLGLFQKQGESKSTLIFEAENLGAKQTSLESQIFLYGFIPKVVQRDSVKKIKRKKYVFQIESSERTLQPNVPKTIKAKANVDQMTPFLWFMTYIITPTRGKTCKIRVRSANKTVINFFQYIIELSGYILFNRLTIEKNT